ncbi:hypothetical protein TELCIR_23092, partial [Teladorsagia circumcincta]
VKFGPSHDRTGLRECCRAEYERTARPQSSARSPQNRGTENDAGVKLIMRRPWHKGIGRLADSTPHELRVG